MRAIFDAKDFASSLALIAKTLNRRAIIPILEGVLVRADADAPLLWIRGTDLETEIETQIVAEVEAPGSAVLPRKILAEMARTWPEDKVVLEVNEEKLWAVLACGEARLGLTAFSPDEFPAPLSTAAEKAVSYNVPVDVLTRAAKQVAVAAAKDSVYGVFSGLLWEDSGDGRVTVVAADTYRMAWLEAQVEREPGQAVRAIIPAQVMSAAAAIEAGSNPKRLIPCELSESYVTWNLADTCLRARLIGGSYPDYRAVIRSDFGTEVRCASSEVKEVVERAALLAKEETDKALVNLVRLSLMRGSIAVNSRASQIGTFFDTISAETEGQECTLTFNARYLLDGLEICRERDIKMRVSSDQLQLLIEPLNEDGIHYLVAPAVRK